MRDYVATTRYLCIFHGVTGIIFGIIVNPHLVVGLQA